MGATGAVDEAEPFAEVTPDVEEAIAALAAAGALTAPRVVEEARDESSPLHAHFDWDDTTAAHKHRLEQARTLIRRVRLEVTVHEHVFRVPAYVHDPARDKEGGYLATPKLANDRDMALRVLRQEVARVRGCLDRARKVAAAVGMGSTMEAMLAALDEAEAEVEKIAEAA
jgi:hypothetical protein